MLKSSDSRGFCLGLNEGNLFGPIDHKAFLCLSLAIVPLKSFPQELQRRGVMGEDGVRIWVFPAFLATMLSEPCASCKGRNL